VALPNGSANGLPDSLPEGFDPALTDSDPVDPEPSKG